ncbi:GNAT family N-acetyltransferase [Ferrithrix thermotolerans]|uniref:GNAT family N-acetyltransferase n=1 Tax=Ferrithrix thermotolerans TaxID=209649 RepID=UPI0015B87221|nr:GNAT family N-acetyltransferase [Ferrithrix thermotolerans]
MRRIISTRPEVLSRPTKDEGLALVVVYGEVGRKGGWRLTRVTDISISEATVSQYEAVGSVVVDAYKALLGEGLGKSYEIELLDVARRAQSCLVIVALIDNVVAGSITYVNDRESPYAESLEEGEVGLRMLAVDPKLQGRGVAKALVRHCIDLALVDGAEAIFLYSSEPMVVAHGIYHSFGFERIPRRDFKMKDGGMLLAFRLDLGRSSL